MPNRIKRMLAFLIDWNVLYLPVVLLMFVLTTIPTLTTQPMIGFWVLIMLAMLFGTMALIAARDIIFGGRSLGKRIFKLYVVDKKTLDPISAARRFVRNIFFFLINWLEIILLLVTGETLGDRVAAACVLSAGELERRRAELTAAEQGSEWEATPASPTVASAAESPSAPRKQMPIKVLIPLIVGIAIVCMIAFVGLIQISLHASRNTEQAQLAYDYVISSDVFVSSGLAPEDLRMNEYSVNHSIENGEKTSTAEITFTVREGLFRKYSFYVTCHKENGTWTVCEECTRITVFGVGKNT